MKGFKPFTDTQLLDWSKTAKDPEVLRLIEQARRANAAMARLEKALAYEPIRDVDVLRLKVALAVYKGET